MRFWDSSAVVPLLFEEPISDEIEGILVADREMVVWWATATECVSAARRREREGAASGAITEALRLLERFTELWTEVLPVDSVRLTAGRLLAVHPLRAADALQLAAALVWRGERTGRLQLVSLDERLRDAGSREGFDLLPAA